MTDNNEAALRPLIEALIAEGEDAMELNLWADMYPALIDSEREALLQNLRTELEQLKKLKNKSK